MSTGRFEVLGRTPRAEAHGICARGHEISPPHPHVLEDTPFGEWAPSRTSLAGIEALKPKRAELAGAS
jgi:hypothetical protein